VSDRSLLSPTGLDIVFALLGIVVVASALLVVTTKQVVHAGLWLVVCLGGVAGCFLVMSAEFVAWMQVLIYVGAVVVLLLFALMLTKAPIGRSDDLDSSNKFVAAAVAVAATAVLVVLFVDGYRQTMVDVDSASTGSAKAVGEALFSSWVLPFEALSVLLLSALVGAIVVSRRGSSVTEPSEADVEAKEVAE
jgi:NADH-quinone oxidoreductase subunit J